LRKEESPVLPGEKGKKKQRAQWAKMESAGRESMLFFFRCL
jgi:hypothetical protein